MLIDPGTFCYVCPDRDRFRGTAAPWQPMQIDGRDQATTAGPFGWIGMPKEPSSIAWHAQTEAFDFFAGRHNGYYPITHHRWVCGVKNKFWFVRDLVTGPTPSGPHRLAINWHFLNERDIVIVPPAGHKWQQSIERFDWSPVYGKTERAQVLKFETAATLPAEFAVVLALRAPTARSRLPGPAQTTSITPQPTSTSSPSPRSEPASAIVLTTAERTNEITHMKLLWVKAGGLLPPDTGGKNSQLPHSQATGAQTRHHRCSPSIRSTPTICIRGWIEHLLRVVAVPLPLP